MLGKSREVWFGIVFSETYYWHKPYHRKTFNTISTMYARYIHLGHGFIILDQPPSGVPPNALPVWHIRIYKSRHRLRSSILYMYGRPPLFRLDIKIHMWFAQKSRRRYRIWHTNTHQIMFAAAYTAVLLCTSAVVWGVCRADDFSAEFLGQNTACIHPIYVGVESNIKYTCSTAHVMHACVFVCGKNWLFLLSCLKGGE